MKRLSTKIIGLLILVFFLVSMITRILIVFVEETTIPDLIGTSGFFLAMISMGLSNLLLFAIGVDFILVRRIKKLNTAILDIEKGDYQINVKMDGHDEISTLAKNLNLMAKELQANEYLNKDFARNVSHEFKTPLSSIKGYAELINHGELTKAETTEYTDIIIHEIDRLSKLSHDLLQISLLDSVEIIKKEDTFSIDEQIRNVLQLTQLEWEGKLIEFELDLEEIKTQGNKDLTFQIWQNLIGNAIKFTPMNGKISITLHTKNGIHFMITDTGIGISEENQKQIFNQFFISDQSRNQSGNGLGLSITKKIVEKLGGTITFESQLNVGTTFSVILPTNNQS